MRGATRLKKLVIATVVCAGCVTPAVARDWTIGRGTYQVGFQDWTSLQVDSRDPEGVPPSTLVLCGFARFPVPLPFWATVSISAVLPIFGAVAAVLIASRLSRRRPEEAA